jgi:AcrR family transcriptional regulator
VVARDGWHGVRMSAVAREAGVSKALVHYYFSTRQALLRAAFSDSEDRANSRAEAELALLSDSAQRLERYHLLYLDDENVFSENRALWSEVWAGMRLDPELRPDVERRYRQWLTRVAELVEEAYADRPHPPARAAEDVALRLSALLDGVESLLVLGLITAEKARAHVRESIAGELRTAGANLGRGAGVP